MQSQRNGHGLHAVHHMARFLTCVGLSTCLGTTTAIADGFVTFGDQGKLADQLIVAAGNISVLMRGVSASDRTQPYGFRPPTVFQISRSCFVSSEDLAGQAGVLVVDRLSAASIAVMSTSVSSIKVSASGVTMVDCDSAIQQNMKQLQDQFENQRKQLEVMLELLKKQQQQRKQNR